MKRTTRSTIPAWSASATLALATAIGPALAQESSSPPAPEDAAPSDAASVVTVTGFRASLDSALNTKKNAVRNDTLLYVHSGRTFVLGANYTF